MKVDSFNLNGLRARLHSRHEADTNDTLRPLQKPSVYTPINAVFQSLC